jgi:metal-sulfur cluster biosynthetic enzyme
MSTERKSSTPCLLDGLFDVNIVQLGAIEAIEVYTSAAQVPIKYNQTSGGCGVMLIWTR